MVTAKKTRKETLRKDKEQYKCILFETFLGGEISTQCYLNRGENHGFIFVHLP